MGIVALLLTGTQALAGPPVVAGITFAAEDGRAFLPARAAAEHLGWNLRWDAETQTIYIHERALKPAGRLFDGTALIDVDSLRAAGATVTWNPELKVREVRHRDRMFHWRDGEKKVFVTKDDLQLRAYQGPYLVLQSRASVGRPGFDTPNGIFETGPYRAKMHYSSLYENAPMPWSVQVVGNVFIHGWDGNVGYANSHGCIRLPVDGNNPAEYFYNWIDNGVPVTVAETLPEVLP